MPKHIKKKAFSLKKYSETDLAWNQRENNDNDVVLDMIDNSFVDGIYRCKKEINL